VLSVVSESWVQVPDGAHTVNEERIYYGGIVEVRSASVQASAAASSSAGHSSLAA
jgi:hypothetical protein